MLALPAIVLRLFSLAGPFARFLEPLSTGRLQIADDLLKMVHSQDGEARSYRLPTDCPGNTFIASITQSQFIR